MLVGERMHRKQSIFFGALFLGSCFVALCMMPLVLQRYDKEYEYHGISIMGPDAETYYAARVREVYDGDPTAASAFYGGNKDVPYLQPPLPEMTIAYPAKLLHIDPVTMFQLSRVFWGFAVAVLFFLFVLAITGNEVVSFVSTALALFAGAILAAPWLLPDYFSPASHGFEFLRFSRVINPQFTVSWFLIAFLCISEWLKHRKKSLIVGAGLSVIILIYSYVYAWTLALATMGFLTLWFLWKRDWKRIKDLAIFWAIALLGLIPYFIHLHATTTHPWFATSSLRMGLVISHAPVIGVWSLVFIAVAFLSKKVWPKKWPLLPALSLGAIVALNQHVITGSFIVPHHYHWYFIQPLASLFAVALVLTYFKTYLNKWIAGLLVIFSLFIATVQQWGAYQGARDLWGRLQFAAPVIAYIRDHAEPGDTVYASDKDILNMIPIYTSADVYTSTNAMNVMAAPERPKEVYYFELWLNGVTPEQAEKELSTTRRIELSQRVYAIHYREALGAYDRIPDSVVQENISDYKKYYALSLKEKLTRYPLTLFIRELPERSPEWLQIQNCTKEIPLNDLYELRRLSASCLK